MIHQRQVSDKSKTQWEHPADTAKPPARPARPAPKTEPKTEPKTDRTELPGIWGRAWPMSYSHPTDHSLLDASHKKNKICRTKGGMILGTYWYLTTIIGFYAGHCWTLLEMVEM